MAKRRKKRSRRGMHGHKMAGKCKTYRMKGGARTICWGANGKIKSNKRASGTAGISGRRKGRKRRGTRGIGRVSRAAATKSNGTLRKGCRFVRGGGAVCK